MARPGAGREEARAGGLAGKAARRNAESRPAHPAKGSGGAGAAVLPSRCWLRPQIPGLLGPCRVGATGQGLSNRRCVRGFVVAPAPAQPQPWVSGWMRVLSQSRSSSPCPGAQPLPASPRDLPPPAPLPAQARPGDLQRVQHRASWTAPYIRVMARVSQGLAPGPAGSRAKRDGLPGVARGFQRSSAAQTAGPRAVPWS